MKVKKAIRNFLDYHTVYSGKKTARNYRYFLNSFETQYGDREIGSITSDDVLEFLSKDTEGQKPNTKRFKYSTLKTLFNFTINITADTLQNPCDNPVLKKTFRMRKGRQWNILEKDVVDEIIFKTPNPRDRLMLELIGRGGMRIGEVLKLRARDVDDRKLFIMAPKSGRQSEVVFIPKKVADRLKEYIRFTRTDPDERVFPLGHSGATKAVKGAGMQVGIDLKPHDLRRHAATYASRSGAPIEIVSKVILRHANLSTTQRYLGKVSDTEAIRWTENIHG
jgi:integrase